MQPKQVVGLSYSSNSQFAHPREQLWQVLSLLKEYPISQLKHFVSPFSSISQVSQLEGQYTHSFLEFKVYFSSHFLHSVLLVSLFNVQSWQPTGQRRQSMFGLSGFS